MTFVDMPKKEERIHLARQKTWSGHDLTRDEVLSYAEKCLPDHEAYAPDLMEEWCGMAEATGLSLAELVVGHACYGIPFVILLHLKKDPNQPEALVFTTTGCLGQIGMNEYGLCIGLNNLVAKDGQIGVTWNFVVRKAQEALQQKTAEEALRCVTEARLAGAHNFLIFDKTGTGFNVEAMSTRQVVTPLKEKPIDHTNHCLLTETIEVQQTRPEGLQKSSEQRLELADELLQKRPLTIEDLMAMTREPPICTHSEAPFHVASCGAAIIQPKTLTFWALDGYPDENEYQEFSLAAKI